MNTLSIFSCGDIINFKTYSKSYKNKKRYDKPKENWVIFKDVHEPIINRDDFELVQTLVVKTKRRAPKQENGEKNMFCDFLYCADCGNKLWYHTKTTNLLNHLNRQVLNPILLDCFLIAALVIFHAHTFVVAVNYLFLLAFIKTSLDTI